MHESSEKHTGLEDKVYDLVSLLYHALEGAQTYGKYVTDAELAGDEELAAFFRDAAENNKRFAVRCKELLRKRIGHDVAEDTSEQLGEFEGSSP